MARPDFQKLGFDRLSQNIARSVNNPVGTLVTDDITKGDVIEVTVEGGTGTANVASRRVGAIPISIAFNSPAEVMWSISGTTLSVETDPGSTTGTITFYVF